ERLAPHFRLHLVDLPGHGHSRDSALPLHPAMVASEIAARTPPAIWLGWSLGGLLDRKSTRLNSSHVKISYAVFCLKKKKLRNYARAYTRMGQSAAARGK